MFHCLIQKKRERESNVDFVVDFESVCGSEGFQVSVYRGVTF